MFLLRDDINEIAALILKGGLICYPTDTVWGIGCDAKNPDAIQKLADLKGDPPKKGYVVLVDSIGMLKQYVPDLSPRLETLLALHRRPLTLIYPKTAGLPASLGAKDGSIAIRVAQDEFCQFLIQHVGGPIVSTIAAIDDQPFPPTFGAISSAVLSGVDYVVKYRQEDKNPTEPSPIARLDQYQELDFIRE